MRFFRVTSFGVLLSFLVVVSPFTLDAQEPRTALLIANGEYRGFGSLENPVPEARQLGAALRSLGFDVSVVTNAGREEMLDALIDFENAIESLGGGIAFFHYGGHAVQVDGKNYLIPSDARIPDERRVMTRAVNVDEVMLAMDASGSDTNIAILDACRNNPLPTSSRSAARGLAPITIRPKNSIIAYSAESDKEAMDGVFTPALTQAITRQGASFSDILMEVRSEVFQQTNGEQITGEYGQLFEPVYLSGRGGTSSVPEAAPTQPRFEVERMVGSIRVTVETAGTVYLDGERVGELEAGQSATLRDVETGSRRLEVRYDNGKRENSRVTVRSGTAARARFSYVERVEPEAPEYEIGDRGPAGGWIFYDKGNTSSGWRYLEAAPEDLAGGDRMNWNDAMSAAGSFRFGGYSDWRLPTKDELNELHDNIGEIGGFASYGYYWSSSEHSSNDAWYQYFGNGYQNNYTKSSNWRVRAVRAF